MDDSGGTQPYRRVDGLQWSETEKKHGKVVKLKGFPQRPQSKTVPGGAVFPAHGLCRHQRFGSGQHPGCAKGVQIAVEN